MKCPVCGGEYRDGFARCADCRVDLVSEATSGSLLAGTSSEASVVVLRTADPAALSLARLLLEEAKISFAVSNERMVGLFPSALTGPTNDSKYRAAEIEVLASKAESARAALNGLEGVVAAES